MPSSGESIAQTLTKRTSTVTNKSEASVVAEKTEMAKGLRDLLKAQQKQFDE